MIDSKNADMKNVGGRHARGGPPPPPPRGGGVDHRGAVPEAFSFKETPWAHLDIAGTGMSSPSSEINQSWGLGLRRAPARPPGRPTISRSSAT